MDNLVMTGGAILDIVITPTDALMENFVPIILEIVLTRYCTILDGKG